MSSRHGQGSRHVEMTTGKVTTNNNPNKLDNKREKKLISLILFINLILYNYEKEFIFRRSSSLSAHCLHK